jgi:hypothetical protein
MHSHKALVVCAGMPRSGSTWLYNVIRCLLKQAGKDVYGAWIGNYNPSNPSKTHIVKIHDFSEELAKKGDLIFTSRRDLRDIATSLMLRSWANQSDIVSKLNRIIESHQKWFDCSTYELIYERMIESKLKEVKALSEVLCLDLSSDSIQLALDRVESFKHEGEGLFDSESLLHKNHIQNGKPGHYQNILTEAITERINIEFKEWMSQYNYSYSIL